MNYTKQEVLDALEYVAKITVIEDANRLAQELEQVKTVVETNARDGEDTWQIASYRLHHLSNEIHRETIETAIEDVIGERRGS